MVRLLGSGCAPASLDLTEKTGPVTKEARENAEIVTKLGCFIPDPAKAEDSFRTAFAIARGQGTRGYELHAV
jgi:hypothetical protein